MIILDQGILFIHIPKTAGDSIEYLLEKKYNSPTRIGRHQPLPFFYQEEYDLTNAKIFTVVRNPFDRLVSVYHFCNVHIPFLNFLKNIRCIIKNEKGKPKKKVLRAYNPNNKHKSLEVYDFPNCRINWNMVAPFSHWVPHEYLDKVHVLRFENISEEWESFKGKVGIEEALPHRNQNPNKKKDYQSFYGEREISLIKEIYGWEIDYFGYSFP